MSWLRLIRWNNLLIILFTQLLAWWCVIVPLSDGYHVLPGQQAPPQPVLLLTPLNFSLLCLSTMLIAAAGYIINDYFDIRIDTINKPDKVILEKQIPRRLAIIMHSVMNGVALLLAGLVAWQARHLEWLIIQATCTFLLWRYSTTWKRQFMIGNVVVALLTMLSVMTLLVYEPLLYAPASVIPGWHFPHDVPGAGAIHPVLMLLFLSFFAFILTWMREIVKDMEDFKGDAEEGCITMPIQWGLQKSVFFIRWLGAISLAVILLAACCSFVVSKVLLVYLLVLFLVLLTWLRFVGLKATKQHYHKASQYLKGIMVLGIGTLLIYRYLL